MRSLLLAVLICGCAADDSLPSVSTYTNPAVSGAGIGESCSDVPCAPGLSCTSYYGIAGPQGPVIETCELSCKTDSDCPDQRKCTDVSEGPEHVCR